MNYQTQFRMANNEGYKYLSFLKTNRQLMKKSLLFFIILFSFTAAYCIPERPKPQRLVNDFAEILTPAETDQLEMKLLDFNNRTSTQITVVTVKSLEGMDRADYAISLGEKWKVGQEKFDNGIVVLIKPKIADENGQAFIAVGYGLEAVIPDALAKRIVENEMIPEFKNGNLFKGIDDAVNTLMSLSLGEFSAAEYDAQAAKKQQSGPAIGILIFLIIVISIISRIFRSGKNSIGRRSNLPLWILLAMMNSGGRHSGSFGNFSSGRGSFGGFGGGSFGGGGAGGSW